MIKNKIELGFDIESISTRRDILPIAQAARAAGVSWIVAHPKKESDLEFAPRWRRLKGKICLKTSAEPSFLNVVIRAKPSSICFISRSDSGLPGPVPVSESLLSSLGKAAAKVQKAGISAGMAIEPEALSLRKAKALGLDFVELGASRYSHAQGKKRAEELEQLELAAYLAHELKLKSWIACGLDYDNARLISRIPHIQGLHVGRALVFQALLSGMGGAVGKMRRLIA